MTHCTQRAYWQDGGSNTADNSMKISKLQPRRKVLGSRHLANMPPRYLQAGRQSGQELKTSK